MSEYYFTSSNVDVFPSSLREIGTSKLTTEKNLTNILKSTTDKESYIINWTDQDVLQLVVKGYRFDVKNARQILESQFSGDVYVKINIQEESNLLTAVDGTLTLDSNNEFKGLLFSDTEGDLKILEGEDQVVPIDSYKKIDSKSLGFNEDVADKNTIMYSDSEGLKPGVSIYARSSAQGLPIGKEFAEGSICIIY